VVEALLHRLNRLNRTLVVVAAAVLVLGGLVAPAPYGGVLLLAVAVGLAALLTLTWRYASGRGRLARVAVLALLLLLAVTRLA
jgi:hypothetical protein